MNCGISGWQEGDNSERISFSRDLRLLPIARSVVAHGYAIALLEEVFGVAEGFESAGGNDLFDRNRRFAQMPLDLVEPAVVDGFKE